MIKLNQIKINSANPRLIKDDRFRKLVKSIKEFPKMLELRPIVIDDDGTILGGNMRYRALKELGYKEIPDNWVKKASELTDEEKRRFIIEDNVAFGDWDMDMLANEWDAEELEEWGVEGIEYSVATGDIEEDEIPETPKEAFSKLGDLWTLGRHRLLCGDATKREDVEKLMNGQKADMVFTDPPYGMNLDTDWSSAKSSHKFASEKNALGGNKHRRVIGDNEDFTPELINTIFACFDYCKEIFLWGADYYSELLPDKNKGAWIVWDKRLDESTDKMYGSCFELCWSKTKHKRMIARVKWAGIFGTEKEPEHKRFHPTQKPLALVKWFFDYYSLKDKNNVVDLYGGSGSTLIACEQLNRICYMMEIDPMYCDVIVKRYKALGKEDIILERDGRLIQYEEIKELLI